MTHVSEQTDVPGLLDGAFRCLARAPRAHKQAIGVVVDASLAAFCLWLAYSVRLIRPFDGVGDAWHLFLLLPPVTVTAFALLGIYRWQLRSSNERLVMQIVKGCAVSAATLAILLYIVPLEAVNPRSLFVIYGLTLALTTAGARLAWRGRFDNSHRGDAVAVYGAGEAGQRVVDLMMHGHELKPCLFIDDDPTVCGRFVGGIPVVAGDDPALLEHLDRYGIEQIVLAMPSLRGEDRSALVLRVEALGVLVKTIPTLTEIMSGRLRPDAVRDVSIRDVLGRDEVAADQTLIGRCVTDRCVLVTGGGGSIGSELCRQIRALGARRLIALDDSEAAIYAIGEELGGHDSGLTDDPDAKFSVRLQSITDVNQLEALFARERIDTVFHAAARKHVPIVEAQPEQGFAVNVIGTRNVLDAAMRAGVSDFILISTDKAVRPTNCMGASKRIAELLLQAYAQDAKGTCISMVRFGNVLDSSGSVIPKFRRQIADGGPITITDERMTRYFMTIPEAAQLVLQAGAIATGGEVFVLDMGAPVRIEDLARNMVRFSGRKLRSETGDPADIELVCCGRRPGEKLYEEMFIGEHDRPTAVAKIRCATEVSLPRERVENELEALRVIAMTGDREKLRDRLLSFARQGSQITAPLTPPCATELHPTNCPKHLKPVRVPVASEAAFAESDGRIDPALA